MAGNDVRDAASRIFGLLSNEEQRKRRLAAMMDRLQSNGWVNPQPAVPVRGPTVANAADAIEARLSARDTLRSEAERQLESRGGPGSSGAIGIGASADDDEVPANAENSYPIPPRKPEPPLGPVPPQLPWHRDLQDKTLLPLESVRYRYQDDWGKGLWRDPRSDGRLHPGVDIVTRPGEAVYAPMSGTLSISDAYLPNTDDSKGKAGIRKTYKAIRITDDEGRTIVLRYVKPLPEIWNLAAGERIEAGAPVGTAQSLQYLYPAEEKGGNRITDHIHVEFEHQPRARRDNPMPLTDEWVRRSLEADAQEARHARRWPTGRETEPRDR